MVLEVEYFIIFDESDMLEWEVYFISKFLTKKEEVLI